MSGTARSIAVLSVMVHATGGARGGATFVFRTFTFTASHARIGGSWRRKMWSYDPLPHPCRRHVGPTMTDVKQMQMDMLERNLVSTRTDLLSIGRLAADLSTFDKGGDLGGSLLAVEASTRKMAQELAERLIEVQRCRR
jgi:hypothetical protein